MGAYSSLPGVATATRGGNVRQPGPGWLSKKSILAFVQLVVARDVFEHAPSSNGLPPSNDAGASVHRATGGVSTAG